MALTIVKGKTTSPNLEGHPLYARVLVQVGKLPHRTAVSYLRGVANASPESELSRFIHMHLWRHQHGTENS